MYSLGDLQHVVEHPEEVKRELNRLYYTRFRTRPYNTAGVDVFEEDWDTLIVLDACRYDVFSETVDIEGRLEHRISRGSTSSEWVAGNFRDRILHDTVYVSANLWYARLEDYLNASVYDFIDPEPNEIPKNLNDAEQHVMNRGMHPKTVTQRAIEAAESYPDKRLIVHYMQPHQPYIGPTGDRHFTPEGSTIKRLASGEISISNKIVRTAYRENLEAALKYVKHLLKSINGRTVITADHGEMLGDRYSPIPFRDYGHHHGIYCEQLVKVPWHIVERGERPAIVSEDPPERTYKADAAEVEEHLRDLGYLR